MKSRSCLSMQMSKICGYERLVSVSEATIGGLYAAEDNVSRQVCAEQTLHRQPPSLAFLSESLCYLSTSSLPTPPPPEGFQEITVINAAALCPFVRIWLSAIYRLALRRAGEEQAVNGMTMDRWSTKQANM